jgi:putative heme-binding domain-containing protein
LQVFRGNKAACSGCHRMGYIGKEVGPNLTHIGGSRTPAALLEALLFPSARLEQSYQSSQVLLIDGQIHNGLITRRTGDSVELKINAQRQIVIAMDDIERIEPSTVSVMPKGLTELLTIEEISDLMSLLRSAK